MTTRWVLGVVLASMLAVSACSGGDDDADSTTTSAAHRSTTTTAPSTSSTSTTQPPGTDAAAVTPVLQDLISRYDAAVGAILADPRVAANPGSAEVMAYLALFTDNSSFADGALASWARDGEAGRFYRPGRGGQLTRSTITGVTPTSNDEATFTICAQNSIEVTDAAGNVLESQGGRTAASVVAVRVAGTWRLRDLTEASAATCPSQGGGA
ncbi:MAG: hypothetical protein AB7H92_13775 [Microbacteriaceae bacterium]